MSKGGACECPRVGAFFKLMTSRGQCPRGGGVRLVFHPSKFRPPTWLAGYGPEIEVSVMYGSGGSECVSVTQGHSENIGGVHHAYIQSVYIQETVSTTQCSHTSSIYH